MNSAQKTSTNHQMYQMQSDINAPIMGNQIFPQNTNNSINNPIMERNMYPKMNNAQLSIPSSSQLNICQNQTLITQFEFNNLSKVLKSSGQFSSCPYCKTQGVTRTEETCSFSSVSCGVIFGPVVWILFQALRRKDINCYDADHFCSHCGSKISSYKAC